MLKILEISIGAILAIVSVAVLFINIKRTPTNLRGFYGKMFLLMTIVGLIGGITLITFGIIGLLN